jgi:aminoglycoside 6'-N-acetyltransferase
VLLRIRSVIRGSRTELRPATESDLDLLAGWFADPAFVAWWGGAPLARSVVAEKYVGRRAPAVESYIVEEDGHPIGYIQAWTDDGGRSGGIDLVLVPERQGYGLGPDAGRALAEELVSRGWQPVTVDPALPNLRAIRAWEKAGFVADGEWPGHPDGPALRMVFRG